jgi:pseudouridine synthase
MPSQIRLNKFIASTGIASRRGADELIEAGKVKVNGKPVEEAGMSVSEKDVVEVDGKKIRVRTEKYIIFHKPAGYITTKSDPQCRKTIYDLLPIDVHHLKSAGRLDKDSTGLLIMTNDGDLIQKLTHPKIHVPKVYRVTVEGKITAQDIMSLNKGIEIEKGKIAYADVVVLECDKSKSTMQLTLYQGYNRQIRRMMDKINHPVIALKRIAHANIVLQGLDKGQYRYLARNEVRDLFNYLKKAEKLKS